VPFETGPKEERHCESCLRSPPAYSESRALFVYEGALLEAVHRFKYGGKAHLAKQFGPLLAEFAGKWLPKDLEALVMPVPLYPRRLRQRGFNQSLLLARYVDKLPGLSLDYLSLRRIRDTVPQVSLGRTERRKNVVQAFGVTDEAAVKGRNVLLVDDVSTTGSTLNACSSALMKAGADKIYCLLLARTPATNSGLWRDHGTLQGQDTTA
jgi:ComF family protein